MPRVGLIGSLALSLAALACNRNETTSGGEEAPSAEEKAQQQPPVDDNVHVGAPGSGGEHVPPTPEDSAGAETDGSADPGAGDESKAEPDSEESGATPEPTPEKDPVPDLLKTVRNKRTSDARALAALAEAQTAGASPRQLAEAANARAQALFADPKRAERFYEWAAEKDKTYPDPVFNLARQAVMAGDIPTTKEYLQQVRKRKGGKKLLQQLDFDPTWEIVKDDPEVRDLMK